VKTLTAGDSERYPRTSVPVAAAFRATIGGSPLSSRPHERTCSGAWEPPKSTLKSVFADETQGRLGG
jgi:hypothetical protein